ncbi:uncharacterized protein TNCV_4274121 [Trichonephila clavipes]|nr:uncharacterized protein TNCV_4274121 [Trichonephila clavipes]
MEDSGSTFTFTTLLGRQDGEVTTSGSRPMAHVLLPCDLPSWPDVQRHLSQLSACKDTHQMARLMASLYDLCRVSLDPDDAQRTDQGHPGLLELRRFVEEELSEEERTRFLSHTLPRMASKASDLKQLKPSVGFLYSLRREERRFKLDKVLVSSLLANAFFSTFAKRNSKTHPTLQDFRMVHFFAHLQKRGHQSKLRAFLRYFDSPDEEGHMTFVRKMLQQGPSLPGWLCSDRPLAPLNVRPEGSVHQAEPEVYRVSLCSPLIGGDVLTEANSKEARLFFSFPELLVILSFAEGLVDDEALIAENTSMQGCCFCFLDPLREEPGRQFEDRFLLRELNKALAAFTFQQEGCNSRRGSQSRKDSKQHRRGVFEKRFSSRNSSKVSMRTASQSSVDPLPQKEENYYTADEDSDEGEKRLTHSLTNHDISGTIKPTDLKFGRFVEWAQNEIAVVPDSHKRILFSDEAHFWLNGYVKKQNSRIWREANPQVYVETPLHPEKLTVWCALWAGGIIGPYCFKNDEGYNVTVNGDRYKAMITNFFIPELNNHDVQELWFQQDGTTCHTARATIDLMKDTFGECLILRFGPVNWPPRSCDLTLLDYLLCGHVKSLVYADKPQTLDHLEDNIRRVIADIRPQILEKVIENWTSRLDYIRTSCSSPMPEILFKM